MNPASLALPVLLAACAPQDAPSAPVSAPAPAAPRHDPAAPDAHKPGPPIAVTAELHDQRAVISLELAHDVRDLTVHVRGQGGVTVTAPSDPVRTPAAPAGGRLTIDATFTRAGAGALVVDVRGEFGARVLATSRSFSVGPRTLAPRTTTTDAKGRKVVILPAH